jgi:membrane protein YqaA with SNARE-associated domain
MAGLGNATGELVGYAAGRIGAVALAGRKAPRWWLVAKGWLGRYGFFAILAMALVPNPLFDVIGLLAGSMRYPMRRFWLACLVGNSAKYLALAYLGGVVPWPLK